MMRSTPWILLILALAPVAGLAAQDTDACALTVVAQGVRNTDGSLGVIVFASKEGWPRKYELAFRRQAVPARAGDVEIVLESVPPGRYAVVAMHDENGNKELDRSPSGRPLEGWGMSNNPKARFKAPGFAKAVVQTDCGKRIEIRMQYRKKKDAEDDR